MIEVTPVIEKIWKPNTGKQELYLSLPDSIFEQFYGGAAGGGKTEALLMRPILRQWTDNSRFQGIILRRTYSELEESVIERSKRGGMNADGTEIPSFYDFSGIYNEQKKRWKFPSGATITFGHAEEESDIRKYDTAEYQYCAFDELTSFTEFQYKFMAFSRVRSIIPSIPALVCSASNPGNIGHRWVRERFVEPAIKGGKIIAEKIKIEGFGELVVKRIFIQAFLMDNPRLMENDPMYRVRLEMLPEADKRAKAYGDWWTFSGQVFAEWRSERFPDEPENAIHVVPPFIPDSRLPRVLAIDWGYRAMTFAIWGCPLPNKRAIIYREFTPNPLNKSDKGIHQYAEELDSKTVASWTTAIANISMQEGINPYVVLDPSAWQNRGMKTIAEQFIDTWHEVYGSNPRVEKADNDRIGGKMLVHDYLRWKSRPKFNLPVTEVYDSERAAWILRNKGLDAHKSYLSMFAPQDTTIHEELPKLHITSDCKILSKTIPLCVYDEKKDENNEDVKEFVGDDPYDDLRYFLKKVNTINIEELEELPQEGQRTAEDWNKFYLKLALEKVNGTKKSSRPISFGRRSRR